MAEKFKEDNQNKNTFEATQAFAKGHAGNGSEAASAFASLENYGKNLKSGKESLVSQEAVGINNMAKSIKQADQNTADNRFAKADENRAIKSSINQFATSFAANRESLRQASNQYFETAGEVLSNQDVISQLGTDIWASYEGNRKQKKEQMDNFLGTFSESNTDLFFAPGENTLYDDGELSTSGEEMLSSFTTKAYDKVSRGTLTKVIASPFEIAAKGGEMVVDSAYNMTLGMPVNLIKAAGGDTEAMMNLGFAVADWAAVITTFSTLGAGSGALVAEQSAKLAAEKAAKESVELATKATSKKATSRAIKATTKDLALAESAVGNTTAELAFQNSLKQTTEKYASELYGKQVTKAGELAKKELSAGSMEKLGKNFTKEMEENLVRNGIDPINAKNFAEVHGSELFDEMTSSVTKYTQNIEANKARVLGEMEKKANLKEQANYINETKLKSKTSKFVNTGMNPWSRYTQAADGTVKRRVTGANIFKQEGAGRLAGIGRGLYTMTATDQLLRNVLGKSFVDVVDTSDGDSWDALGNDLINGILGNNIGADYNLTDTNQVLRDSSVDEELASQYDNNSRTIKDTTETTGQNIAAETEAENFSVADALNSLTKLNIKL